MAFKAAVPCLESQGIYLLQAFCYIIRLFLLLSLILKSFLRPFLRDDKSGTVGNSAIKLKITHKPHLLNRLSASEALVEFQKICKSLLQGHLGASS